MRLTDIEKKALTESVETLQALAQKAEQASGFGAIPAAKALAREQLKFNQILRLVLCK